MRNTLEKGKQLMGDGLKEIESMILLDVPNMQKKTLKKSSSC